MEQVVNSISNHTNEYYRILVIMDENVNNNRSKYVVWFQHRLKSVKSLFEKIYIRKVDDSDINDIIGFRLIYPWTKGLIEIKNILMQDQRLNIFKEKIEERGKVFYLFGKTLIDTVFEIQLWPTLIYTCFEFEHDKIYKPHDTSIIDNIKGKASYVREQEHVIQDIIDGNMLVPYPLN